MFGFPSWCQDDMAKVTMEERDDVTGRLRSFIGIPVLSQLVLSWNDKGFSNVFNVLQN